MKSRKLAFLWRCAKHRALRVWPGTGLYGVCCQHVHHRPGLEALPESHARLP